MTAQAGDTFPSKHTLRRELRTRRAAVPALQRRVAAQAAARHALRLLRRLRCHRIALYLAYGSELDTAPLLRALQRHGCEVSLPLVRRGAQMQMVVQRANNTLRRNRYGIDEPVARRPLRTRTQLDAVILPLVGFDARRYRLGTGGGYYDRWLQAPRSFRRPLYLGYGYALQQIEQVPNDPWDVRLDAVITEQGMR